MEAKPLNLAVEHFPFECSLREQVMARYAQPQAQVQAMAMDRQELLTYLRDMQDIADSPLQSILAQTDSIGDPALPTPQQCAMLAWVGKSFDEWVQHYPMEEPLEGELLRLKPLAAALAIVDPDFAIPGGHPLHRILDSFQHSAVGWQASLGRAGQVLQKKISQAVADALNWFENEETDLEAICEQVIQAAARDEARANRMILRMIETERGKAKTTEARAVAALMINAALLSNRAPEIIGQFLQGPWYDSAQLVILKFGTESAQWQQMCTATETLLDSVQFTAEDANLEVEGDKERRQRLFELVSQLPRELKRWMLSLQHDSEAVESAMGMVEYAHIRILRKEPLELEAIEPLPIPSASPSNGDYDKHLPLELGQWCSIERAGEPRNRLKLVAHMAGEGEFLFANLAGIIALRLDFEELETLFAKGEIQTLDSGASFSRSLAQAAGICTMADLESLLGPGLLQVRREEQERKQQELAIAEQQRLEAERQDAAKERDEKSDAIAVPPLAIGTWLGFHDGESPLLAKLAVHDREKNHYIFVNRNGIRLRELDREELGRLIDQKLVDILQTQPSFRDAISRVRRKLGH